MTRKAIVLFLWRVIFATIAGLATVHFRIPLAYLIIVIALTVVGTIGEQTIKEVAK